jgi:hypothetical protein
MNYKQVIPNKSGIPTGAKDSNQVQSEMSRWLRKTEQRKCRTLSDLPYWRAVSHCSML